MVDVHLRAADALFGLTITAAMLGSNGDLAPQGTRNMHHTGLVFGQQRLSTPQAKQGVGARFAQCDAAIFAA